MTSNTRSCTLTRQRWMHYVAMTKFANCTRFANSTMNSFKEMRPCSRCLRTSLKSPLEINVLWLLSTTIQILIYTFSNFLASSAVRSSLTSKTVLSRLKKNFCWSTYQSHQHCRLAFERSHEYRLIHQSLGHRPLLRTEIKSHWV